MSVQEKIVLVLGLSSSFHEFRAKQQRERRQLGPRNLKILPRCH